MGFSNVWCWSVGNLYHQPSGSKVTCIDVAPTDIGLMVDGLVIGFGVLTRVDDTIIKAISDCAAKGVDEVDLGVDLLEPSLERVDVAPP